MLDFGFRYKDDIINKLVEVYLNNRIELIQFTALANYIDVDLFSIYFDKSDWKDIGMVSLDKNKNIIGIIYFYLNRHHKHCTMSIISFNRKLKYQRIFYNDIYTMIERLFNEYEVKNILFGTYDFNKRALSIYDKMAKESKCRYIGCTINNFYYNEKYYNEYNFQITPHNFKYWKNPFRGKRNE